ncbi:MAG: lipopolysaccharide biosynthesis protein [Eubacteriales bacterium]|nr:lipopolysaccharide biosynthesis protein [Eubacteriales bacterium]
MDSKQLKGDVIKGLLWKALENGGDQVITFVISIILARLLGPSKYGTMSVMLIFIAVSNVIIQTGFQTSLIQKKDIDDTDYSSVFWLGLVIALILFSIIFVISPYIATYFGDNEINPMLRTLSVILFFGAATSVLIAMVSRRMDFRIQCIATIVADIISGIVGILAAIRGLGTWALVLQQLIKNLLLMILLMVLLKWAPKASFSLSRVRVLFSYGWKVLVSGLIDTIYTNLYTPVISKLYDPTMVGFYTRANQFPQIIANSAGSTMQAVLLPTFSKTQDDNKSTRVIMRRSLKMGSFILFPAMFGIMAVSEPMVKVILGDDWMGAVTLLRLCALGFAVWHIHIANLQAINASGRSDIYLKLEIFKKIIGVLLLIVSIRLGVAGMIFVKALWDYVCTFINAYPNKKLNGYGPVSQWRDILPEFIAAAAMGVITYGVGVVLMMVMPNASSFGMSLVILMIQILTGIVSYILMSLLFKLESFYYALDLVKGFIKK